MMRSIESPTFSNKIRNISTKTEDSLIAKPGVSIPVTSSQFHKVMKRLQNMIRQQKQKRQKAEQQIDTYRNRLVDRQAQFKRIIQKYKTKAQNLPYDSEIQILFSQILTSFDKFNHETELLIEEKYEESLNSMTRRIRQIMGHVNQWMIRTNAKLKQNPDNIKQQIRVLYEVATQIQDKNIQMVEQVKSLRFENKLLKQQRQLIIEQLTRKKNKITTLNQQISTLKQNIQLIQQRKTDQKEAQIKNTTRTPTRTSDSVRMKMGKLYEVQSTKNNSESKKSKSQIYSSTISNFNYHKISNLALSNTNKQKESIDHSGLQIKNLGNSHLKKNKSQFHYDNKVGIYQNICTERNQLQGNNTINLIMPQSIQKSSVDKKYRKNKINFYDNVSIKQDDLFQQHQGMTNQKEKIQKEYQYIHTIQNLKKCLKRQKAKVISLGSVVTQISNQNKEINSAIQQILNESKQSEDRLKTIAQSAKLFNTLRVLKQRLSMIQHPSVSCGWGDVLIDI